MSPICPSVMCNIEKTNYYYCNHSAMYMSTVQNNQEYCFIIITVIFIVVLATDAVVAVILLWVSMEGVVWSTRCIRGFWTLPRLNYRGNTKPFWILYYRFIWHENL